MNPKHLFLTLSFSLVSAFSLGAQDGIRFEGSDLLRSHLEPLLNDFARANEFNLFARWQGSFQATQSINRGQADIGIVANPGITTSLSLPEGWISFSLAYQPILIGVHPTNPLDGISLDQVAGIFGVGERMNMGRWGEIGLDGVWDTRPFALFLPEGVDRLATDFFRSRVMQRGQFRAGIVRFRTQTEIQNAFRANLGAIAILPRFPDFDGVRLLSVRTEIGATAYNPSESNIHFGDYPLRLPFLLVLSTDAGPEVKRFAEFLLSDEVARVLRTGGYAPVPSTVRQGFSF
jgi:ABC-type phosphate transport system substrate-binding protein